MEGIWYASVDPEWVLEQNPDIIIVYAWGESSFSAENAMKMKAAVEEIMNRPELANVNAVKNGNVYAVAHIASSGLQGVIWAGYCAKWFHPDLFEDLDTEAIHQEYIDRFLRIDYDVKGGTFVYPEPS